MYNILLVDDEKLTSDYLCISIPKLDSDWSISNVCYDAISALEWLNENTVDLVITDIKMPEMNGLELCRSVLDKKPQQKIIILSGYDEFQFAQQAIKYGVKDYLLKPISLPHLKDTLDAIKLTLNAKETEEYMYNRMLKISEEGKTQIVSRFMQAVITNSYVETKSLYPIIHRMKIHLLDGAGIIMLMSLDEDILLAKKILASDISLYKYILYQLTIELAEQYQANIWISLDHNEDVVILFSAETYQAASNLAQDFFDKIKKYRFPHMSLPLSCGQSSSFEDILMLNDAYQEAVTAVDCRLFQRIDQFYIYDNIDETLKAKIEKLRQYVSALNSAIIKEHVSDQILIIDSVTALLSDDAKKNRIAIGQYLVKTLSSLKNLWNAEEIMYILSFIPQLSVEYSLSLREYLLKVISLLSNHEYTHLLFSDDVIPEGNIVDKAKQYIHLHYAKPISLSLIAEEIGVSPNYLSTLFHNEVGESYIKYLTGIRMENAINYMKCNPNIKIYEIAEKVGYVNVKHFSYVFKQYFSISPGEYQQNIL